MTATLVDFFMFCLFVLLFVGVGVVFLAGLIAFCRFLVWVFRN